jgi:hypothetical protein
MPARIPYQAEGVPQQKHGIGIFPGSILRRKKNADVGISCRTKNRISYRMGQHIPVGVAKFPLFGRDLDTPQKKAPPCYKAV